MRLLGVRVSIQTLILMIGAGVLFLVAHNATVMQPRLKLQHENTVKRIRAEPDKNFPTGDSNSTIYKLLRRVYSPDSVECVRVRYVTRKPTFFSLMVSVWTQSTVDTDIVRCKDTGLLEVAADSLHSAASGLHHYCSNYAACAYSWGQRKKPQLPSGKLPVISVQTGLHKHVITKHAIVKHVYYMNFCTHSYTMAFWDWPRWEKELDWMVVHGVTLPLIMLGREVVMRKLFRELGMADESILNYFTGPAFLAWHRMGNLKSFGGPLPESYLDHSHSLALKVLERARELGMKPVLPGFSGHVPDELETLFPQEQFSRLPPWSGFSKEYSGLLFVEPTSSLYTRLGKRFIEIQTELYGTDHYYAVDQFNENDPKSDDVTYLKQCGQAQMQSLQQGDSQAVWVMQGWLFVFHSKFWGSKQIEAYISDIPASQVIVLDLISEATPAYESSQSYHHKPFIWNVLHNFGGQNGMRGNLQTVMDRPYKALKMHKTSMAGIGLTMEAINQNPIMYELALDHIWHHHERDLTRWVRAWVRSRYGYDGSNHEFLCTEDIQKGWHHLQGSLYNVMDPAQGNGYWGVTKSVIEKYPSLNVKAIITDGFQGTMLKYDACEPVSAWKLWQSTISKANPDDIEGTLFELDFVDLTKQVLSNHAQVLYRRYFDAVKGASEDTSIRVVLVNEIKQQFLTLMDDMDTLLSKIDYHSFYEWERSALALAQEGEEDLYLYNARNLVTMWGPQEQINDYSSRLWGGLIGKYYRERWRIAMDAITHHFEDNSKSPPHDGTFSVRLRQFEETWQHAPPLVNTVPQSPTLLQTALKIYDEYQSIVTAACKEAK